jgi:hypothetical protein|tara:strand:- start:1687 stop:1860 length:174 start_codon:yes stop_codon:yes gene_type:complete
MRELKINRGIELMLRRAKQKEEKEQRPSKGFTITKLFTLLKRKVYFNLELRWDKQET